MIRTVLLTTALAVGITGVLAQGDPITERKNLMKTNGAVTRTGTQMGRGEIPFDLGKAREVFANYQQVGTRYHTLFPENTKTGGETKAAPRIWEDMPGFRAASLKFAADASAASAATTDLATFRTAFGAATQNCNSCHETYRINR